jgi:hypothetical protein
MADGRGNAFDVVRRAKQWSGSSYFLTDRTFERDQRL